MTIPDIDDIFSLSGQTAIVTGAANGLGLATAQAFAGAGADLVLIDIKEKDLEKASESLRATGRKVQTFVADVTNEEQITAVIAEAESVAGSLDILVNNAGYVDSYSGMFHEHPTGPWLENIDLNLNGVFYCSRAVLKGMYSRRKGKIINVASLWAEVGGGFINLGAYAATKAAVANLTRDTALQYAPYNIQINAISPGFFHSAMGHSEMPELIAAMEQHTPAGRVAQASELQGTMILLASSASNFMNGSVVYVDGGYTAR
jgi:NAD(P)-dependent dehydrogenase (short-subunit alcohol dehydrogenase family)